MKVIIAPTDFTAASLNAVNYAADLALALKASLLLLNVIQVPIAASTVCLPDSFIDDILSGAQNDLEDLKKTLLLRSPVGLDITATTSLGTVFGQIQELSDRHHPIAVVMALEAGKPIERLLLGSNAFEAANYLHFPLLVIPEKVTFNGIRKIGLASDLMRVQESVPFDLVTEWLSAFDASLDIIEVSKLAVDLATQDVGEALTLQNHLSKYRPTFHFLEAVDMPKKINEFITNNNIDLLMVVKRHHGFADLFRKKHLRRLMSQTVVPVLCLHD